MKDLNKINFWKRLETFVKNIQVNDAMSEEEKDMILRIAKEQSNSNSITDNEMDSDFDCDSDMDDEDDLKYYEDDLEEEEAERLAEIAYNCTCGAWQFNESRTKVFHVADCCCGAE